MPLLIGSRIGPYEIVNAIGRGGMGEVYRARDSKLNLDVALKVLPESFASDPDRFARFRRAPRDIWVLPITAERKPMPFLVTPFNERLPIFSHRIPSAT